MLKIALCDNGGSFRERLKQELLQYADKKALQMDIEEYDEGEAFERAEQGHFCHRVLFINLGSGTERVARFVEFVRDGNKEVLCVFLANSYRQSLEGFRMNAIRCLWKRDKFLKEAVTECMDAVCERLQLCGDKICLRFVEGEKLFAPVKLLYVESRLHKLMFYFRNGAVYTMYGKLGDVETVLVNRGFIRCHQSFLVNVKGIVKIERNAFLLENGSLADISRTRFKSCMKELEQYRINEE